MGKDFSQTQMKVADILKTIKTSLCELHEIAHEPNFLTEPEYIDILIQTEQQDHRTGDLKCK